ncbi:MAG: undecaprenyl-phosphate glucose phosphotransferase [Eubacteriales bacterium]|nr:undecaprenyl-phosphate glucose phosphotransferase [Eubacteriales bacterium]
MIRNNQGKLNVLHVMLDAVVTAFSYFVAWLLVIYLGIGSGAGTGTLGADIYFGALLIIIPLYLILYGAFGLYLPKRVESRRAEFRRILRANLVGLAIIVFVLFAGRNIGNIGPYLRNFSTRMILAFFVLNNVFEYSFRFAIRTVLRTARKQGYNQKNILLVGYSDAAEGFIDRCIANPEWGYKIFGILSDSKEGGYKYRNVSVVGGISELEGCLKDNDFDEIAVTLPLDKYTLLKPVVNTCEKSGVHTKFVPDYGRVLPTIPYTEDLEGLPVINIRHVPLTRPINRFMKRAMDIAGSGAMLLVLSPVMLVVAIIIKCTDKGPVLYSQERVGLHNKPFKMYKFRSMFVQPPEDGDTIWTVKNDPRVTPIGRIIRKTNIDELPQLINILRGDMSLVGPRPERPHFVEKFKEEIPRYMIKHQVRPGLTGWAQVNGLRGDTSIEKRIEYDLYYIENWTVGFDIKILFETLFKGFKNAY